MLISRRFLVNASVCSILLHGLLFLSPSHADENQLDSLVSANTPNSYCGLLCVYAFAHLQGKANFEFHQMVKPEYLSGQYGSTIEDIKNLCIEFRLGIPQADVMTLDELRFSDAPVFLHVRPPFAKGKARHWILFLGIDDDGKFSIYDPPVDRGSIDASELQAIWKGTSVSVSDQQTSGQILLSFLPINLESLFVVFANLLLLRLLNRHLRGPTSVVFCVTMCVALIHLWNAQGFARNSGAVQLATAHSVNTPLPTMSYHKLKDQIAQGEVYLVDARSTKAFKRFHLPNSCNLPIDSGLIGLKQKVSTIPRDAQVVVYCQSERCDWAETVAARIYAEGVRNLFVFPGGVEEWLLHHGNSSDD